MVGFFSTLVRKGQHITKSFRKLFFCPVEFLKHKVEYLRYTNKVKNLGLEQSLPKVITVVWE